MCNVHYRRLKLYGDVNVNKRVTHGLKKSNKRLYRVWTDMRARCSLITHQAFHHYGSRGIRVCTEWQDFAVFHKWAIENGYTQGLSIERINVDGNYEPSNCKWATQKQQNNNKTDNRYITFQGVTKTLMQWTEEYGLNYYTIWSRIQRGWTIEDAIVTPLKITRR